MIYRQLLACFFLFTLISLSARAVPRPSPAGGRMLQLDETHDFFGTGQAWFADEQFEQLTVEAWIYFEELPERGTFWSIIGQEGRFNLVIHGNLGGYGASIHEQNATGTSITSSAKPLPIRKWLHIVVLYNGTGVGTGINGRGGVPCCQDGHLVKSDKPLRVGGIVPQGENRSHFVGENLKFRGYIDEVRISNILRYEERDWKVPDGKFKVDEHTVALWHFNESPWSGRFKDESENGYYLWKGDAMPVEAKEKLTTLWGKLKR